jgi:hypothetical protein
MAKILKYLPERTGAAITRSFHRLIRQRDATFARANSLNLAGFSTAALQRAWPAAARLAQIRNIRKISGFRIMHV